jgi:hypothetical protein
MLTRTLLGTAEKLAGTVTGKTELKERGMDRKVSVIVEIPIRL